jgi:hypothetical protein
MEWLAAHPGRGDLRPTKIESSCKTTKATPTEARAMQSQHAPQPSPKSESTLRDPIEVVKYQNQKIRRVVVSVFADAAITWRG